jgi:hypothetical protein
MSYFGPECKGLGVIHDTWRVCPVWHSSTRVNEPPQTSRHKVFRISENPGGPSRAKQITTHMRIFGITPIFAITPAGMTAMAIAVFALWSSIAMERAALRRAAIDEHSSLETIQRLREEAVPASHPESPYQRSFSKSS